MVLRFFLFASLFLFISCSDIKFDNPDDPKSFNYRGEQPSSSSSSSSSSSVVLSSSSSVAKSSSSKATNGSVECNGYCKWNTGCFRIATDPIGEYGSVISTCDAAIRNCTEYSPSHQTYSDETCGSITTPSSSSGLCASFVNGTKREHYGMEKEQFCDPRDRKKYVYVTIGEQIWMAENLAYEASGSKCYGNKLENCEKYGRLYEWVMAQTACPSGWHIPHYEELTTLIDLVGSNVGTELKATSGWNSHSSVPSGSDTYGFSALPGGAGYSDGRFVSVGIYGLWWSRSTSWDDANYWTMYYGYENVYRYDYKSYDLLSVRCLKD